MTREYKYVDLGFDSFDRAYEPEVITYCCDGAISTLNSAMTYSDSISAQATSSPTVSISADNLSIRGLDGVCDSVATVSIVNTVSDQLSKLTQALQELADASGMYLDNDFSLKKKNQGITKSQFSNRLELGGGIQKLKKSALLTI
jgi:hypothetical protein